MSYQDNGNIERLDNFLDENLDDSELSIEILCKELGISRSQLHRIVKEKANLPVTLYVRKRRLKKAQSLLATTELRISEIADAVGINNPTNFSKYFIEEFNVSPTDFRKQFQEQENVNLIDETFPIHHSAVSFESQVIIPTKSKLTFHRFYLYAAVGVMVILVGSSYFFSRSQKDKTATNNIDLQLITENSIAILPFKNLGSPENSFFCDGVMEQIHGSLSLLENLKVISKSSSMLFRDTQKPIPQIANELHVKYILEGSVLQIDQKIRITVELSDASENRSVWTKSYDGDFKDVFTYMSKVAKEVAGELNQKLSRGLADKIDKSPTKNLAAYNEYLRGKQLLQTRVMEKIEASIVKFSNAITLDSTFADAFVNEALAYFLLSEDQIIDEQTGYKLAEKNALTAIRIDSENGLAYAILAYIYQRQNKWDQAITTYQIALNFSPNDAQINYWYSLTIRSVGRLDEAIKYSTKAVSLDPLAHNIYGGHIIGCAYAGRFDFAEKAIKDGELIFNDSHLFHNAKGFYFIKRKNYAAALNEFRICHKLNPKAIYFEIMIAFTQAQLGQLSSVEAYLKALPQKPENYKYFAIVYAGLGNKELCLKYLDMAADNNDSPNYLKVSPLFDFLHQDARFEAILQQLGLSTVDVQ